MTRRLLTFLFGAPAMAQNFSTICFPEDRECGRPKNGQCPVCHVMANISGLTPKRGTCPDRRMCRMERIDCHFCGNTYAVSVVQG